MTGRNRVKKQKNTIKTLVATTDGFEIAEVDLQPRAPGDVDHNYCMESRSTASLPADIVK
jgi:RecG-like helicase